MSKMPSRTAKALVGRGFVLNEKGHFEYAMGSVSNYTKVYISEPIEQFSLEKDAYVLASYVKYESFAEAGYIEIDWHKREEGHVAVNRLLDYLTNKGIKKPKELF